MLTRREFVAGMVSGAARMSIPLNGIGRISQFSYSTDECHQLFRDFTLWFRYGKEMLYEHLNEIPVDIDDDFFQNGIKLLLKFLRNPFEADFNHEVGCRIIFDAETNLKRLSGRRLEDFVYFADAAYKNLYQLEGEPDDSPELLNFLANARGELFNILFDNDDLGDRHTEIFSRYTGLVEKASSMFAQYGIDVNNDSIELINSKIKSGRQYHSLPDMSFMHKYLSGPVPAGINIPKYDKTKGCENRLF